MSRHADAPASVPAPVTAEGDADRGDEEEPAVGADPHIVVRCSNCGREAPHDVALAMLSTATDGVEEDNRKFAQCPGRVLTCTVCGTETRSLANR